MAFDDRFARHHAGRDILLRLHPCHRGIQKGSGLRGRVQSHEVYPWFPPILRPFRPS
jgi:hypothetical protein